MTRPFDDFIDVELHVGVADHGSVRLAAQASGISQPAASRRLHSIERRAGAALYKFGPRGGQLTAAGRFWEHEARTLLAALSNASDRFTQEFKTDVRRLRIAAGHIVADYLLPHWLVGWSGAEFGHFCDIEVGNSTAVRCSVTVGRVELGLFEIAGEAPADLSSVPLVRDRLVLVVAPSNPLARRRRPLSPDQLARISLTHRERESGTQEIVSSALAAAGYALAPAALEVNSTTAVKAAAAQGVAPAIVPALSVQEEIGVGRLREVPLEGLDLTVWVHAVHRRGTRLSNLARSFFSHVQRQATASSER